MVCRLTSLGLLAAATLLLGAGSNPSPAGEPAANDGTGAARRFDLRVNGRLAASYFLGDDATLRPYFSNVCAPDGTRITRRHPPVEGENSTDHADMHPGVWLAFGDIGGGDFWRNRGRVEHVELVEPLKVDRGTVAFTVRNRYMKGDVTVCSEICRHAVIERPRGLFILYDSRFQNDARDFTFGDQEEMGLGVRVADALRVRGGNGRIRDAEGRENEGEVRGSNARWCDYSGIVQGRRAGIVLMPHPGNFRKSWYHARNYGVLVANPFGRRSLTGGEPSRVTVRPGTTLRLRFGLCAYSTPADQRPDCDAIYDEYLELASAAPE